MKKKTLQGFTWCENTQNKIQLSQRDDNLEKNISFWHDPNRLYCGDSENRFLSNIFYSFFELSRGSCVIFSEFLLPQKSFPTTCHNFRMFFDFHPPYKANYSHATTNQIPIIFGFFTAHHSDESSSDSPLAAKTHLAALSSDCQGHMK